MFDVKNSLEFVTHFHRCVSFAKDAQAAIWWFVFWLMLQKSLKPEKISSEKAEKAYKSERKSENFQYSAEHWLDSEGPKVCLWPF